MNRRDLFKGIVGLAAGLLLPPTLAENAETARRYWALGAMPESDVVTLYLGRNADATAALAKLHAGVVEDVHLDATWVGLSNTQLIYCYDMSLELGETIPKVRPIQRMKLSEV